MKDWEHYGGILSFDDGIDVDTRGDYRTLTLKDGCYVVGRGSLIPCADAAEADTLCAELKKESK
jgi:hypothetical protein